MLACSCIIPDTWVKLPIPEEEYDLDNPSVFIPLSVCMAPYGAVVFTIAARPAFDDGTVQDWAEFLAQQNNLTVESIREARVNRMPCVLVDATMSSEMGPMRSRSVFLEDGKRLFNLGALAPQAVWDSVEIDFNFMLGAFRLDESQGITTAPLRQMTSEPAVDLTAMSQSAAADTATAQTDSATASLGNVGESTSETSTEPAADDINRPAIPADVAIADDASTLDPELAINVRLRDSGAGFVPRVHEVNTEGKYAVVGVGAIEALFKVPFGWHVIDDGRRTLVFDVEGNVQISLNLREMGEGIIPLLTSIGDELASANPQGLFLKTELLDMLVLAGRDLSIDGETLDQAYLAKPSHRDGLALVCRVTASRENMTRAMDTAEVILTSIYRPTA